MYKEIDLKFIEFISPKEKTFLLDLRKKNNFICTSQLLDLAIALQSFLVEKFNISNEFESIKAQIIAKKNIFFHRQNFIQRLVLKNYKEYKEEAFQIQYSDEEFCVLLEKNGYTQNLQNYAAWAIFSDSGKKIYKNSKLFNPPHKISINKLFDFEVSNNNFSMETSIIRNDFNLFTKPPKVTEVAVELNYCLYCHERHKDSCRTGFKKTESQLPNGCPLDQKISEMNFLAQTGDILAAIAIAMIDNPFLLLTGNRICNDCIKGCIFQDQTAVDVPLIESGLVDMLLKLPYGFEIYYLLTDWNPLKFDYIPLKPNGKKVLVCGLGPAGIALSYYMLRKGYTVEAIDAMEIKDLNINPATKIINFKQQIELPLEQRSDLGFGGVMEHGITARWNKNFLTAMHIILKRNLRFSAKGNILFGRDIDLVKVQKQNFCFIGLCSGSGNSNMPAYLNPLPLGVINSKDFLLAVNLQTLDFDSIKSPVVILGSGLTAVDCSTEAMACLKKTNQKADVKIVSRGGLINSQAYKINHQEIASAMQNGIIWLQDFVAEKFVTDNGHVTGILDNNNQLLQAKTIIIAIGTKTNIINGIESYDILDAKKNPFYIIENKNIKVGIFGDLHPLYKGSVVKALASAKDYYNFINLNVLKH